MQVKLLPSGHSYECARGGAKRDHGDTENTEKKKFCIFLFCILFLAGCTATPSSLAAVPSAFPVEGRHASATLAPTASSAPTSTAAPTSSAAATLTPVDPPTPTPNPAPTVATTLASAAPPTLAATPENRLAPEAWQEWPVIPALSAHARQVLKDGLAAGRNPRAFAKVGDCETLTDWFLVDFDRGARFYDLGPYISLQPVIDYFAGSFERKSAASARGFTAASALSSLWANPDTCQIGETPLSCEYHLQQPILSFIMLGTNDVNHKGTFEANLRKILDQTLAAGILPVLVTKADNLEGDHQLNATIARLAYEYDVPLWNFWLAVQDLPNGGLQEDGAHLTYTPNRFNDPLNLQSAWAVRNITALQVLQVVMQAES
jgi:hypothetical protein